MRTHGLRYLVLSPCLVAIALAASSRPCRGQVLAVGSTPSGDPLQVVHERMWDAWFSADTTRLRDLLTTDFVALNAGDITWSGRDGVIDAATEFAASGRVLAMSFPSCEERTWGIVAVLFCQYVIDVEQGGRAWRIAGRSTEVFLATATGWIATAWHLEGR